MKRCLKEIDETKEQFVPRSCELCGFPFGKCKKEPKSSYVIETRKGWFYSGNPGDDVDDIVKAWKFDTEEQAKSQCEEGESVVCIGNNEGYNLNYTSWIVVDTKLKTHGLARHNIGTTMTKEQAEKEAGYFNWSWNEKDRFKAIETSISFTIRTSQN